MYTKGLDKVNQRADNLERFIKAISLMEENNLPVFSLMHQLYIGLEDHTTCCHLQVMSQIYKFHPPLGQRVLLQEGNFLDLKPQNSVHSSMAIGQEPSDMTAKQYLFYFTTTIKSHAIVQSKKHLFYKSSNILNSSLCIKLYDIIVIISIQKYLILAGHSFNIDKIPALPVFTCLNKISLSQYILAREFRLYMDFYIMTGLLSWIMDPS